MQCGVGQGSGMRTRISDSKPTCHRLLGTLHSSLRGEGVLRVRASERSKPSGEVIGQEPALPSLPANYQKADKTNQL